MLRSERILQLAVAATLAGGLASAASASNLAFDFNNATGTGAGATVANQGTWGSGFTGHIDAFGSIVADSAVLAGSGSNAGMYAPMMNVLKYETYGSTAYDDMGTRNGGTETPAPLGNAAHTAFWSTETDGTNHTNQDSAYSFWMRADSSTALTGGGLVGIAGAQVQRADNNGQTITWAYQDATGAKTQQTWFVDPVDGGWGTPRINAFNDVTSWHYYTLTNTTQYVGAISRVYKDGVLVGVQPGNNSRSPFTAGATLGDQLGLRVGGHQVWGNGANNGGYFQGLRYDTYDTSAGYAARADAIATAAYNAQFYKPGDADRNRTVDGDDADAVIMNWLGSGKNWSQGDFNQTGTVDGDDADAVIMNWQSSYDLAGGTAAAHMDSSGKIYLEANAISSYKIFVGDAAHGYVNGTTVLSGTPVWVAAGSLQQNQVDSTQENFYEATIGSNGITTAAGGQFTGVTLDLANLGANHLWLRSLTSGGSYVYSEITVAAAVPEPASLSLLALGGLGLLARRRRMA